MATESEPSVYFDANPLKDRHLTGIGRYTSRLALAVAARRRVHFFEGSREILPRTGTGWSQDQDLARWARRIMSGARRELAAPPPGSLGVWCCLRPSERTFATEVSILHDLTPQIVPTTHTERTRGLFQGLCAITLASSDAALAVSHSTRADATWLCNIDPSRIAVAHSGPSLCVERHAHRGEVRRRPNVGLVVSTLEPRKNPFFLLDWFQDTDALTDDAELWWVGPLGWLTSRRTLNRYRRGRRRVRFLGVVSDARLCRLYQTAGWSIYPSLYEGFGFPVLDALRHGTPVLTSGHSALREFTTPGVFFFDPYDPKTVDHAWSEFRAASPVEINRHDLDRRYNWDRVAQTLLDLGSMPHPASRSEFRPTRAA